MCVVSLDISITPQRHDFLSGKCCGSTACLLQEVACVNIHDLTAARAAMTTWSDCWLRHLQQQAFDGEDL